MSSRPARRPVIMAVMLVAALLPACWVPDPLFCRSDSDCLDLGAHWECDEAGEFSESNHVGNTCFEPNPDAGPDDAAVDGASDNDATVPPPGFARILYWLTDGENEGQLHAVDVNEGVLGPSSACSAVPANGDVNLIDLQLSASGDVAVYIADERIDGVYELFWTRRSADGIELARRINQDLDPSALVVEAFLRPDGSATVFGTGVLGSGLVEQYYFVDLSGPSARDPVPIAGAGTKSVGRMSDDGNKFVFIEDQVLYLVNLSSVTPSAAVRVSAPGVPGTEVFVPAISPTSDKVAYLSDANTNGTYELFVADISQAVPGDPEQASAPIASGQIQFDILSPEKHPFSSDGKKLGYFVIGSTATEGLYIVDVGGAVPGPAQRVNGPLVANGHVISETIAFSPEGRHVAYRADQRLNDVFELFLVDISGTTPSPPQRISGALTAGGDVTRVIFAPDGSGLAYTADQVTNDVVELFYVDLRQAIPSAPTRVNENLPVGGRIEQPLFSSDGDVLAFVATPTVAGPSEVLVSSVAGAQPGPPLHLQVPTNQTSVVHGVTFSADAQSLVWHSNAESADFDVWHADLKPWPPGEPAKVNAFVNVFAFRVAP